MALFNKVDVFMEYDVFKMVFPLTTNPFMTDLPRTEKKSLSRLFHRLFDYCLRLFWKWVWPFL